MKVWAAVVLFVLSLLLLLFSAATLYYNAWITLFLQIIALLLGIAMISKSEKRTSVKALGIITTVFSGLALFNTLTVIATALVVLSALSSHGASSQCFVTAQAPSTFKLGYWQIGISAPEEGRYVYYQGSYYKAPPGYKVIMFKVRATNLDQDSHYFIASWSLITEDGMSYGEATLLKLNFLFEERVASALVYEPLSALQQVPPGASVEGTVMFVIPSNATPKTLYLSVTEGLNRCKAEIAIQ
ncbi:hypothetical protein IPA_02480 [Ignicoccus pacificus DSM 13166]|uniref:DUF4352 domain-containing protein n=1 Tax=Ignicoccus pacificus DSM 13166 TaxID=940294 RepID=A0A977KAR0_9CREN|nr:hypothetical protein IPA_02480 [Ignicoccus pacificus DSM 13166]